MRQATAAHRDLIREFHPRFADTASAAATVGFERSDAQPVVARLYGFASWTKLRDHVGLANDFTRPDPADVDSNDDAHQFVALVCVSYNGDHDPHARAVLARTMLDANPGLASASTAAIEVGGHHRAVTELIEQNPKVVNEPCGPNAWPPLLYCCSSRLDSSDPARSTLATARTLLEAGADPNDGQALCNNGLAGTAHDDAAHLQLLVEFGLGTPTDGPWYQRFATRLTAPDQLLDDELEGAARRGLPSRRAGEQLRHMATPVRNPLNVTIVAIAPPFAAGDGVLFGLQFRHDVDDPRPASTTTEFHTTIDIIRTANSGLDFAGDHVHGRRGDRFICLAWGIPDQRSLHSDVDSESVCCTQLVVHHIDPSDEVRRLPDGRGVDRRRSTSFGGVGDGVRHRVVVAVLHRGQRRRLGRGVRWPGARCALRRSQRTRCDR